MGNVKRLRKSGEVFDAHLTSSPITDGQGKVIGRLGVLLDITLMATGGNKNELNSQSEALAQISRIISSSPDIDEVFDLFAEHARENPSQPGSHPE